MLGLIVVIPGWAKEVAFVDNFYCGTDDIEWRRNEQEMKFVPHIFLQEGDIITIKKDKFKEKKCFITLLREDCTEISLKQKDAHPENGGYRIKSSSISFDLYTNIKTLALKKWDNLLTYDNRPTEAGSRTPEEQSSISLRIPLLQGDDTLLKTGERILYLGWYGGTPPYQVKVVDKNNKIFLDKKGIEGKTVSSEKHQWAIGTYQVIIRDGTSGEVEHKFTVVEDIKPLSSDKAKEIQRGCFSKTTTQPTRLAGWLVEQDEKWRLEAYQLVAPIHEKYYPAFLLKQGLMDMSPND